MMMRLLILIFLLAAPAAARDAAFVDPKMGGDTGVLAKPKPNEIVYATPDETDVGETIIGITKRMTIFFNNSGTKPAKISELTISADSNVRTEIVDNDCATIAALAAGERCSIGVQITPNSPGPWTAEVLAVHDAPGRVTRSTFNGTTAGEVGNSGQQPGLSLLGASKDQIIDFGDVEVGVGRAVRTILLINDSPSPLKIESIDLVAAERGLGLSKDGCQVDQEIPAGSSCPVTAMWQPLGRGDVSTDLIIRHTGPVGFAVIPVRGKTAGLAAGGSGAGTSGGSTMTTTSSPSSASSSALANFPSEQAAASLPTSGGSKIPPISAAALFAQASGGSANVKLTLRGTVGQRAILADGSGAITVATVGQVITSEGIPHKIIAIEPNRVLFDVEGVKAEVTMGNGIGTGGGKDSNSKSAGSGSNNTQAAAPTTSPASIAPINGAALMGMTGGK